MKDQSKEDSSVKMPQLSANLKGSNSTIKSSTTTIKGTPRNNSRYFEISFCINTSQIKVCRVDSRHFYISFLSN